MTAVEQMRQEQLAAAAALAEHDTPALRLWLADAFAEELVLEYPERWQ